MNRLKIALLIITISFSAGIIALPEVTGAKTLPPRPDNQPINVFLGLQVLDIIAIDQPNQTLSGRFEIITKWNDDRESFVSIDGTPQIITDSDVDEKLKNMWTPDLEVANQSGSNEIEKANIQIYPDGTIIYRTRVNLDISTNFDFTRFPFDEQELAVEFESFSYPANQVIFRVLEDETGISKYFRNDEWVAYPLRAFAGFKRSSEAQEYDWSYATFQMKLERRTLFYVLRIMMPYCFFILMSTCVFWMQRENLDRRVSIVVTFALTSVAFNFLVLQYIPNVPYRTMISTIIASGYFSSGVIITLIVTFQLFRYHGYEKVWSYGNILCRFIFLLGLPLLWFIIYFNFMRRELQIIYLIQ